MTFDVKPATWPAFEAVMGEKGGCGGCWCMLWRLQKKQMDAQMGDQNRLAMKTVFNSGHVPGLIAWHNEDPVGWIQVDVRNVFPRLTNSRVLKPIDDLPVWSVSCFFIKKEYRRKGLSALLLDSACGFVRSRGGSCIEGYPVDSPKKNYPAVYAWIGLLKAYTKNGFTEVGRRSPTRPIMRKALSPSR